MEKYYLVRVEETLSRTYKVKANSEDEAEQKMEYAYREKGTVVLDVDDFCCGEIFVRSAKNENLNEYEELELD